MTDLTSLIRMVSDRHGKLPSAEWLARTAKVTPEEAQQQLDQYVTQEAPFQTVTEAPTDAPALTVEQPVSHVHGVPMAVLRWIAGILAAGATIRAMFYALGWFHQGDDEALSWLTSGLVVGVTVVMPQMAVVLWRNGSTWLSALAFVLTAVVMSFSMLMTVGGIYNARTAEYNAHQSVQDANLRMQRQLVDIADKEAVIAKQIESATREQARLQTVLDGMAPGDAGYSAAQARLDKQTKRVDTLRGDLYNLGTEKAGIKAVEMPRQDFFDWIGEMIGWSRGTVEFVSALIPAIVIDVAAPVLLFVVLFI